MNKKESLLMKNRHNIDQRLHLKQTYKLRMLFRSVVDVKTKLETDYFRFSHQSNCLFVYKTSL